MRHLLSLFWVLIISLGLAACGQSGEDTRNGETGSEASQQETESQRLMAFFERVDQEQLNRSPEMLSYRGVKERYGEWDDYSTEAADQEIEYTRQYLAELQGFDYEALDSNMQLSYRLFEQGLERTLRNDRFRYHFYPVNQFFGFHTNVPTFMINVHRVDSLEDAEAYISRLNGIDDMFAVRVADLEYRESLGIMPPRFAFGPSIEASRNIITGAPFAEGEDTPLYADIKGKINALDIADEEKTRLITAAEDALLNSVQPAYEGLIAVLERQAEVAPTDDGVWRLPDGADYYSVMLKNYTTTDLTADEIHEIGLENVARIHGEMRAIMDEVGFEGSLQDFFVFTRTDDQFFYPNTDEGRQAYLDDATAIINRMYEALPEYFGILPKAPIEVRRVEAFRENAAGKAFYNGPTPDGSRPGIYYANLRDMRDMPKHDMESLAYHEGVPGHHMQVAIQTELENVPTFQKFSGFTAFSEGWGLYSEELGKDMGFYEDPYSDFGRLAAELWRAARLVVDTGLHHKRWTREETVQYLMENTPFPEGTIRSSTDRYIVFPGQATAYLIGKLKIMEMRDWAMAELGERFDYRGFHDTVLENGAVPLNELEYNVRQWVESVR